MASYGSLFLHHLAIEGKPIYETSTARGRLETILAELPDYTRGWRDVAAVKNVLRDVVTSVFSGGSLLYETSVLATLIRHASILGCGLSGEPCFGRCEPVVQIVTTWDFPGEWAEEFPSLYAYRMYADGRVTRVGPPTLDYTASWCTRARVLLNEFGGRFSEQN